MEYSQLVMESYLQLEASGMVDGWEVFTGAEAGKEEGEGKGGEDEAAPHEPPNRSYSVFDLRVGGGVVTDLKREQCALLLANGVYQEKAWVN